MPGPSKFARHAPVCHGRRQSQQVKHATYPVFIILPFPGGVTSAGSHAGPVVSERLLLWSRRCHSYGVSHWVPFYMPLQAPPSRREGIGPYSPEDLDCLHRAPLSTTRSQTRAYRPSVSRRRRNIMDTHYQRRGNLLPVLRQEDHCRSGLYSAVARFGQRASPIRPSAERSSY